MSAAIQVEGLVKRFGDTKAVNGVTLTVPTGTVLGLLGPNGAGKTTTVRMLATLIRPDGGRALVHGYDVVRQAHQVRRLIGLTGQYATVDEAISGRENLYLIGRLLDLSRRAAKARAEELLERFALVDAAGRPVSTYSGGMRRRLDLAASLVGEPRVLYLDEPTTGLDPRSRNNLWDEVRSLVNGGATVLLTTQYMEEAEALADTVVVIDGGRVVASGPTAELRARVGGQMLRVRPVWPQHLVAVTRVLAAAGLGMGVVDGANGVVSLPIRGAVALTAAVRALGASGLPIAGVDTYMPSLDEVFLTLTRSSARGLPGGRPPNGTAVTGGPRKRDPGNGAGDGLVPAGSAANGRAPHGRAPNGAAPYRVTPQGAPGNVPGANGAGPYRPVPPGGVPGRPPLDGPPRHRRNP
jgi:oleandomycin transport system ATP-binding protein